MTKYTGIIMEKEELDNNGRFLFKPVDIIDGIYKISEDGKKCFIDDDGVKHTVITNLEMSNSNQKYGVGYVIENKELLRIFPGCDFYMAQELFFEQCGKMLNLGFAMPEFNETALLGWQLDDLYTMLYQSKVLEKNPEYAKKIEEQEKEYLNIVKEESINTNDLKYIIEYTINALQQIKKLDDPNTIDEVVNELIFDLDNYLNGFILEEDNKEKVIKKEEKQKEYEKVFENVIDINDPERYKKIKETLDKYVVGQDDAKIAVINSLKMNERRQKDTMKINTLLVGPTGCGKTYIAEKLAEITKKPFLNIDTTELSLPGLVGTSIESKLEGLLRNLNFDVKAAQNAIVLFDEIDKQASNEGVGMGENIYNTLLGFIQGKTYTLFKSDRYIKPIEFDTKNMMVISTGSFAKFAQKNNNNSYHKTNIGFVADKNEKPIDVEDIVYPKIDGKFLKNVGMPDELVGRVNLIAQLDPMNRNVMKDIILNSEDSALNKAKKIFLKNGVQLEVTEDYVEAVIDEAIKLKTGARSLKFIISQSIKCAEYETLINPESIEKIILTKDSVENNQNYKIVNKKDVISTETEEYDFKEVDNPYRYKHLKNKLDEYAIGQEEAKKAVVIAIKRGEQAEAKNERIATLLVGPTGCGKTFIAETASKITDRPFISIDATELSLPGLVGTSIESKLESLVESVKFDVEKAKRAIVVFDEIDKPASRKGLNMGESVYHTLLGFLNGKTYTLFKNDRRHQPIEFDTSFLTVISTGSFAKAVKNNKFDGLEKNIGFKQNNEKVKKIEQEEIEYPEINMDFLKKAGLPNELVGRIETVEQLQPMTKEMMKDILLKSTDSPLIDFKLMFESDKVQLRYTKEFINALIEEALKLKTGARSLRYVVTNIISKAAFDISMNSQEYDAIILTKETVYDNNVYEKVRKQEIEQPKIKKMK